MMMVMMMMISNIAIQAHYSKLSHKIVMMMIITPLSKLTKLLTPLSKLTKLFTENYLGFTKNNDDDDGKPLTENNNNNNNNNINSNNNIQVDQAADSATQADQAVPIKLFRPH